MTGKQLKEFAARVSDDSIVEVRERSYGSFESRFEMQARLSVESAGEAPAALPARAPETAPSA